MKTEAVKPKVFEIRRFDERPPWKHPSKELGTYVLETNDAGTAHSCLAGSLQPMAAYVGNACVQTNFHLLDLRAQLKVARQQPARRRPQPRRRQRRT